MRKRENVLNQKVDGTRKGEEIEGGLYNNKRG